MQKSFNIYIREGAEKYSFCLSDENLSSGDVEDYPVLSGMYATYQDRFYAG